MIFTHFKPGSDTNHFLHVGCVECTAATLSLQNLGTIESWYRQGIIGQDAFEAYTYVWSISAWRMDGPDRLPHPDLTKVWEIVTAMHEYNRSRGLVYGPWS